MPKGGTISMPTGRHIDNDFIPGLKTNSDFLVHFLVLVVTPCGACAIALQLSNLQHFPVFLCSDFFFFVFGAYCHVDSGTIFTTSSIDEKLCLE